MHSKPADKVAVLFQAWVACAGLSLACGLPAHAQAQAQAEKVITVARSGAFVTLDPQKQFDGVSSPLVELVYSRLLSYAYLERPFKLQPDLLERMPEVDANRLSYRFTLRSGVRFRDDPCFPGGQGREVTADDVLYTLKRFADANVNTKSWEAFNLGVVGLQAYRDATQKAASGAALPDITGFKRTGRHSFTLTLARANPQFLPMLAGTVLAIVPEEAVRAYGDKLGVKPVGTGPFLLDEADRKGVLRFTKYTRYHGRYPSAGEASDQADGLLKAAGRQLPLVDRVDMPLIEEAQPAVLKFLRGELDVQTLDRAGMSRMVDRSADGRMRLKPEFAGKYSFEMTPALEVGYLVLNLRDPLFADNVPLRQALAHLVDARQLIDLLRSGRGSVAQGLVPDGMLADASQTEARARAYDVAQAKRLLAAAGYPEGKGLPPLTISFAYANETFRTLFDFLRQKFAAGGVVVKPNYLDFPTYERETNAGKFQLGWESWGADVPLPESMYTFLHSKSIGGGWNHSAWKNTEFDRLLDQATALEGGPQKVALIARMNAVLYEQVPIIPVVQLAGSRVVQKWLLNAKLSPLTASWPFLDVDMAQKQAAR